MVTPSKGQSPSKGSSGGGAGVGGPASVDLTALVELLSANCDKLLDILQALEEADLIALCQKLLDLTTALQNHATANAEALATLTAAITALCEKMEENGDEQCKKLEAILDCLKKVQVEINCPGAASGDPVTYTNTDNTTELAVSLGGAGDIKISAGNGDGSDQAIADYITDCLAAGNDVAISWVTFDGSAGSATLLAAATTNPFPDFYNQSTDATGADGKLTSMTAQCLAVVEPQTGTLVSDPCALAKLQNLCAEAAATNNLLTALLAKYCQTQYPCLQCSSVTVDDTAVVAAYDSAGLATPLEPPVTGPQALAAALTAKGFVVDNISGNTVTVCGTNLLTAIELEGGAVVNAVAGDAKLGTLTCDPGMLAAIVAGNQQLCTKLDTNNDLLAQLLCCFKQEPEPCPLLTNAEAGSNFVFTSGPESGNPVAFPTGHETNGGFNGVTDMTTLLSVDCDELEECYGVDCTSVTVRMTADHKAYGQSHSGHYWSLAGAAATAVSGTTTMPFTPGNANAPMGPTAGLPDETAFVERWIEWTIPKDVLCAGAALSSLAFESFNGADGAGEDIQNIRLTIEGCK